MEETIARTLCLHMDAPVIDKKKLGLFVGKYCLKGLYPHNFEMAVKSMTSVQIRSIHINSFKNVKENQKDTPLPW